MFMAMQTVKNKSAEGVDVLMIENFLVDEIEHFYKA